MKKRALAVTTAIAMIAALSDGRRWRHNSDLPVSCAIRGWVIGYLFIPSFIAALGGLLIFRGAM